MRQLLIAMFVVGPVWACSCLNTGSPCTALGGSAVIFVADVLVDSGEGWGAGPAKVAIVEALQNVPEGLKEATIETMAGSSCYRRLRAVTRGCAWSGRPSSQEHWAFLARRWRCGSRGCFGERAITAQRDGGQRGPLFDQRA